MLVRIRNRCMATVIPTTASRSRFYCKELRSYRLSVRSVWFESGILWWHAAFWLPSKNQIRRLLIIYHDLFSFLWRSTEVVQSLTIKEKYSFVHDHQLSVSLKYWLKRLILFTHQLHVRFGLGKYWNWPLVCYLELLILQCGNLVVELSLCSRSHRIRHLLLHVMQTFPASYLSLVGGKNSMKHTME